MLFRKLLYLVVLLIFSFAALSCGEDGGATITPDPDPDPDPDPQEEYIDLKPESEAFEHPGLLHSKTDFDRIKLKVEGAVEPWQAGWEKLTSNSHASLTYTPSPTVKLIRGGNSVEEPDPDNYSKAFNDVAAAYQTAIRWKVTGDDAYAEKSIEILNAWANTCEQLSGDPNVDLAGGIYGFQFANAGEIMRDYEGWSAEDFENYQNWMLDVFYSKNHDYLTNHQNSCPDLFWANWDLCNLASTMAIGVLTDRHDIYNEAIEYLQEGEGNGNLNVAILHVFEEEELAQLQESGRDQGHATLVISLIGTIVQMAWNQGDDFFGYKDNMFLKACEYTAKYNVAKVDVPFEPYTYNNCREIITLEVISEDQRGATRPMYSLPYNHYVKIKGLTAPYSKLGVNVTAPEGGGGNYGPNSGGYDALGFGTLMYTLD